MYSPHLSAAPTSWYAVAFSDELKPGQLVARALGGHPVVIFRGASGAIGAIDAICPHLGAHLGHGGLVVEDTVQCPFHGFCFDGEGRCVRTGYDTAPPPRARGRRWEVRERHGLVLLWLDETGAPPRFEIPDLDMEGWTPPRWTTLRVRGNVQEIGENSVDMGHFSWVHRYRGFQATRELEVSGGTLRAGYRFRRPGAALGQREGFDVHIDIFQHGLGYALVETDLAAMGLRTRQWVLARPGDADHVELSIAMSVQRVQRPGLIHPLLKLLPRGLLTAIIARAAFEVYRSDVNQDRSIWDNKRYLPRPALAEGDGPIGRYRQWARQFHGGTAEAPEAP